jgi:hypothetical protein
MKLNGTSNQITGPNAGGPRLFAIPTSLTTRVGQFRRSATQRVFRERWHF